MSLFFFLFSFITVMSSVAVISSRNPVHSVFFLILAFVNSAGIFVLAGAEFLAMILLINYMVKFPIVTLLLTTQPPQLRNLICERTLSKKEVWKKFCLFAVVEPLACSPSLSPGRLDYPQNLMYHNFVALWTYRDSKYLFWTI